jgi:Uma2 family endonuclease
MSAATRPRYTIEQYADVERYANVKHEFCDGQIWATAGGTPEHARMAMAVGAALTAALRGKPCAVYSSDVRVRVAETGLDTYPDVTVVCGGERRDAGDPLALTNPVVLVEVTSDSSEAYDRGDKFDHYKRIEALRQFVVVSHRARRVEVFSRGGDGSFTASSYGPGQRVVLASIGCELEVDEVYRDPFV